MMTSMSLKPQRWGKTINMVETDPSTVEESSDDTNDSKAMRNITNVLKTTSLYSPRFMARRRKFDVLFWVFSLPRLPYVCFQKISSKQSQCLIGSNCVVYSRIYLMVHPFF